ncbi:MAG TPA: acVLRF1 family peptidyl-tRNA hydrolase [Intrasporangium sp.]|uniref:acVLRF1 family peptidyl-tRNA hydrolase n=1 Tax=Intrasporangium sp. TaxID=1925024 RepID=UPI002D782835|nr:acVLRF1 family peptidyl-tRNA hydrolase [Intrasporangium sp.]HET7398066.1 acVLRF1 family peptidyl-tRNA hydrolase [Intrasporangium sp.]
MSGRVVEVDPGRWDRWVAGFVARHGPVDVERSATGDAALLRVLAADGATATAQGFEHDPLGLVLVRRGGYAVGLARGPRLLASKVGTRRVQSRTAAGGWSQQRYARRRRNQADELVAAVADHARRILLGHAESPSRGASGIPHGLVVGGDRTLVREVLDAPALRALRVLPRRELPDLRDPDRTVLEAALRRGRALRVVLTDPHLPDNWGAR